MIPFAAAALLLMTLWMGVALLAIRENRALKRQLRELEAELETRKAGK